MTALKIVDASMTDMGLNYAFGMWKGDPVETYWIGEYQETSTTTEDGLQESTFILTGFTRGTWSELEATKQKIEKYFNKVSGKTVITDNGSAVAIFYGYSLIVPTGDAELKRIEINLEVKEWKVI